MRHSTVMFMMAALLVGVGSALPAPAKAQNLVLAPTRVVLEGRTSKDRLLVSNPSDKATQYRVELVHRRMLEDGTYETIKEPREDEKFADELVRLSPRAFTLEPKSSQTVRIQLRKPKDLAEGEYRSHIQVQVIPDAPAVIPGDKPGQLGIQVQVNYGMSIPLIVRNGDVHYAITISDIEMAPAAEDGKPHLKMAFNREGNSSVYGDIAVTFTTKNGKDYLLKFLPGLSVFTPNKRRTFDFPVELPEGLTEVKDGELKVTYRKQEDDGGTLIAEQSKAL